jgi:hypothetical protein
MKTLKPQRDIVEGIAKLVIRVKPALEENAEFYGQMFAAKAYSDRTRFYLGLKNSKKDTEDLSSFINLLNSAEQAYEKLSAVAKKQISHAYYSLDKSDRLKFGQRDHYSEGLDFLNELARSAKEAYEADWVVDRSDPVPYSVCRAIYWLAPKIGHYRHCWQGSNWRAIC